MSDGSYGEHGSCLVRVRAQVMTRDDSTGGWVPMGGGGLSNVSVRRRVHLPDDGGVAAPLVPAVAVGGGVGGGANNNNNNNNGSNAPYSSSWDYQIYGKRISDQTVVLSCGIKKDFTYNKVMPTFHHWRSGDHKFGLTFQTSADAKAFDKAVHDAIDELLDDSSENRVKHCSDEPGDDDVFMALELPLDSRSSTGSSSSTTSTSHRAGSAPLIMRPHPPPPQLPYSHPATPPLKAPPLSRSFVGGGSCCTGLVDSLSSAGRLPPFATPPTTHNSTSSSNATTTTTTNGARVPCIGSFAAVPAAPPMSQQQQQPRYVPSPGSGNLSSGPAVSSHLHRISYLSRPSHTPVVSTTTTPSPPHRSTPSQQQQHHHHHHHHHTSANQPHHQMSTVACSLISQPPAHLSAQEVHLLKKHERTGSDPAYSYVQFATPPHDYSYPNMGDPSSNKLGGGQWGAPPTKGSTRHSAQPPLLPTKKKGAKASSQHPGGIHRHPRKLQCKHCEEEYSEASNRRGACPYAPDPVARVIDHVTGVTCAQCLLYHCGGASDDDHAPDDVIDDITTCCCCGSSSSAYAPGGVALSQPMTFGGVVPSRPSVDQSGRGRRRRRVVGVALLSLLLPCLWCYLPLKACHRAGVACAICGGKHEAEA